MIALYVLGAMAVLPPVVMGAILVAALSPGPACPACGGDTLLLRLPVLGRWLHAIERRWCLSCGWHGLTRRGPAHIPRVPIGQVEKHGRV